MKKLDLQGKTLEIRLCSPINWRGIRQLND
jgi:hypothetical protein